MSTYEISKSSLLSLKAEILRKQQELIKTKANNEVKIKIIKKNTPLEIKNKGVDARKQNDVTEEEEDLLKQSKSVLEAKSKLYDKLSSGKFSKEEQERNKRYLVRFDKKSVSKCQEVSNEHFQDSEPDEYPESDGDYYHSDEDTNRNPEEKWVDYTDCLGRTRKCLQKDLGYLMAKDKELMKTIEEKSENKLKSQSQGSSAKEKYENETSTNTVHAEHANDSKTPEEAELLSSDMRRELLREQWEKEEEELRNKTNIHYQDILFGEARAHGVGYYGFSKDEEERAQQQEALKRLRDETEAKQKRAQELKALREKQLAARIKAAKERKRIRLGLPPELEDTAPQATQPEITEEEQRKQEKTSQEEEKEKLLEEARKKHVRPWDIGKEGINVKSHYEMTQEEWVEKKRDERPEEFAPPQIYGQREFRSTLKDSCLNEVDKSLKFTTKKSTNKKQRYSNLYNTNEADAIGKPTVSESLPDHSQLDSSRRNKNTTNYEEMDVAKDRRRGVEIAPPPTFDYYGPSFNKKPKVERPEINIQTSIEAGLKFLRKQVEEKQTTTKRYNDFTSPF